MGINISDLKVNVKPKELHPEATQTLHPCDGLLAIIYLFEFKAPK